jgi:molybdenum cofactor synthesis domain-containing protein
MIIGLLVIGDEILSGDRQDANTDFFISLLKGKNLSLDISIAVSDRTEDIVNAFIFLSSNCKFLITSGGLGLTPDDVTLSAISKATNFRLVQSLAKEAVVRENLANYPGSKYNKYIDKLSLGLENSRPIPNSCGIAAGENFIFEGCNVFVLPGVPNEFRSMLTDYVLQKLPKGKHKTVISYFTTAKESSIIDFLEMAERTYHVKTSSYPPVLGEKFLQVKFEGGRSELEKVSSLFEKFVSESGFVIEKKET